MDLDTAAHCAELARGSSPSAVHQLVGVAHGPANTDTLAECLALAERACETLALADDDAMAVRLCIDEACANVVMHAYSEGAGPLALACWASAESVVVCVADAGVAFDPNDAPPPVLEGELEDRPIGGLGWFLVAQLMDESRHIRTPEGFNLNTLTRRLGLVRDEAAA